MSVVQAEFVVSAAAAGQFPRDGLPEIAFAGRSNVGKSSLLNRLVGQKGLAVTSKTPGRTRLINFFRVEKHAYFVDLPGYGYAAGGRDPYWIERAGGRLLEVPPATLRRLGMNFPAAGGAYFRLLPYALVRSALRDAERRGVSGTFYVHPWEYDPAQPRFKVPLLTHVRHYGGLGRLWGRLEQLLAEFRFTSIADGPAFRSATTAR